MPLIVAPVTGYDSLVSLAEADAYWAAFDNTTWAAATEARRESALRRGTQYILSRRPLLSAISPVVHTNVAAATAEAALLDLEGKLYPSSVQSAPVIEKTVGPLTVRYGNPTSTSTEFPVIRDLLVGLTSIGFGPVMLERV